MTCQIAVYSFYVGHDNERDMVDNSGDGTPQVLMGHKLRGFFAQHSRKGIPFGHARLCDDLSRSFVASVRLDPICVIFDFRLLLWYWIDIPSLPWVH
jgi:hypothetical protein